VSSFVAWLHGLALGLGGVGLFTVAFLDSSFLSLPQINDLLVVLMVAARESRMPYYVAMATAGSVAGCLVLHGLAAKGGEALLRRRYGQGRLDKALAIYRRHGALAIVVPALLPPPAPFKLFVLAAGVARVRRLPFAAALTVARGGRYVVIGILSVYYGDAALELVQAHGRGVALALVAVIAAGASAWWLLRRRAPPVGQIRAG
jgi:membrane protein YqaA with SNARE-associated domain